MGNIEEKGIAYWNLDFGQLMPGSQVYVPISSELLAINIELNERVAASGTWVLLNECATTF